MTFSKAVDTRVSGLNVGAMSSIHQRLPQWRGRRSQTCILIENNRIKSLEFDIWRDAALYLPEGRRDGKIAYIHF